MPEEKELAFVPARYIGNAPIGLHNVKWDLRNIDGSERTSLLINHGDTLMMPRPEIIGFTILEDPRQQKDPLYLGDGRVVLPKHAGKSAEELDALGYVFNIGRSDFELIEAEEAPSEAPAEPLSSEPTLDVPAQNESEVI